MEAHIAADEQTRSVQLADRGAVRSAPLVVSKSWSFLLSHCEMGEFRTQIICIKPKHKQFHLQQISFLALALDHTHLKQDTLLHANNPRDFICCFVAFWGGLSHCKGCLNKTNGTKYQEHCRVLKPTCGLLIFRIWVSMDPGVGTRLREVD